MLKELIKLANHLDQKGHRDLADRLDGVIKMANPLAVDPAFVEQQEGADEWLKSQYSDEAGPQAAQDSNPLAVDPAFVEQQEGADEWLKSQYSDEADDADDEALDWSEASDSSERINKLAELMSGEFSTYVPGTFSR